MHLLQPCFLFRNYTNQSYTVHHSYLRFLQFILSINLSDNFIHIGLQNHSTHDHFSQYIMDLKEAKGEFKNAKYSTYNLEKMSRYLNTVKYIFCKLLLLFLINVSI